MSFVVRKLLHWGDEREAAAMASQHGRPDALRRVTLAVNARLLLVAAALLMPLALFAA